MTAATFITLRETLEASLVVGIVLAFLDRTKQGRLSVVVWLGVLAGVVLSLVFALLFQAAFSGFTGLAEQLYEGITMLAGAGLLTWMIFWMLCQRRTIRQSIERDVEHHLSQEYVLGLFFLALISTLREGVETVLFLQASVLHVGGVSQLIGGLLGIAVAVVISIVIFRGMLRLPLKQVFSVTSVFLILFAAGLVMHGIHEFEEAGFLPPLIEHVWDLSAVLNEEGVIGSLLRSFVGYKADPSLLQVIAYLGYLFAMIGLWKRNAASVRVKN